MQRVAWITRNRPESLLTSIGSLLQWNRRRDQCRRLLIVDASDSPIDSGTVEHRLGPQNSIRDYSIDYSGPAQRTALIAEIKRRVGGAGIHDATIDHGLNQELHGTLAGAGINHNLLQLLTIDECVLSCDDDILFEPLAPRSLQSGLVIGEPVGGNYGTPVPEAAAISDYLENTDQDFIQLVDSLLGWSLGDVISSPDHQPVVVSKMMSPRPRAVAETGKPTVGIVCIGQYGEIATHSDPLRSANRMLLNAVTGTFDGVETYDACRASTVHFSCAERIIVTQSSYMSGMCFASDNGDYCPPYLPLGRGQDTYYCQCLTRTNSAEFAAFVPIALKHAPAGKCILNDSDLDTVPYNIGWLFRSITDNTGVANADINLVDAMQYLGQWFVTLSHQSDRGFDRSIAEAVFAGFCRQQNPAILAVLEADGVSPLLRDDFHRRYNAAVRLIENHEACPYPDELRAIADRDEARVTLRRIIRSYGELLGCWHLIRDAARELKQSGFPSTVRIF